MHGVVIVCPMKRKYVYNDSNGYKKNLNGVPEINPKEVIDFIITCPSLCFFKLFTFCFFGFIVGFPIHVRMLIVVFKFIFYIDIFHLPG